MRFFGVLLPSLAAAIIGVSVFACDSSKDEDCCEPSPTPGCCMSFGGYVEGSKGVCGGRSCDGMPVPGDPGWKLETDSHGCRMWTNPHGHSFGGRTLGTEYCGEMFRTPDAATGACCEPSPSPDCCMSFGGYSSGECGGKKCDGMPVPSDPGWALETDSHGCQVWTNPNGLGTGGSSRDTEYCGVERYDAGVDVDAGPDASD